MINRTHALPVVRQCQLLALSRSTAYYQPTTMSSADLALMRRIDEQHLECPFDGVSSPVKETLTHENFWLSNVGPNTTGRAALERIVGSPFSN